MSILYTIRRVYGYRKVYQNWIDIITKIKDKKDQITVILRSNKNKEGTCTLPCVKALVTLVQEFMFDPTKFYFKDNKLFYDDSPIIQDSEISVILSASGFVKKAQEWYFSKYNVRFNEPINYSLFENFVLEQYNTEIQGDVIDIGANIGDSAIYFALKGASHVYAFEPLSAVYKIALQNIKLNNLEDKITLINAAVGSKEGKVKVPSSINIEESGGFSITNQGDVEVPVISFNNIIKMTKDPYLLKMDCEGCEADIIFSTELNFDKIFVELHQGITKIPHKKLIKKLEEQKYKCEERMKIDNNTKLFYCIKSN